jgi:multidrug resistance efflux pump
MAEVLVRDIRPAVQGIGTFEAKVVVQLAAKQPSRIVSINVDQGDAVRKGQPLIQLDAAEIRAEVERAAAALERAKLAVLSQEAAVQRAEAQLPAADAASARARANQTLAQANADRWRKLAASGVVPVMGR